MELPYGGLQDPDIAPARAVVNEQHSVSTQNKRNKKRRTNVITNIQRVEFVARARIGRGLKSKRYRREQLGEPEVYQRFTAVGWSATRAGYQPAFGPLAPYIRSPLSPVITGRSCFNLPRRDHGGPRSWIIVTIPQHENLASCCFSLQTE